MSVRETWKMCCPACKSDEAIDVAAVVWVRLVPDGTDADESMDGSHEWDSDSVCSCGNCGHAGTVRQFEANGTR